MLRLRYSLFLKNTFFHFNKSLSYYSNIINKENDNKNNKKNKNNQNNQNLEHIKTINAFKPRNNLQQIAKELNLIALNDEFQDQAESFKQLKGKISEEKRFVKQNKDSAFTRFNTLTRKLIREFLSHKSFTLIGRLKVINTNNQQQIDFNLQRFTFENTPSLGLMLFAFSDEDSLDNFQNQIKGKAMETVDVSSNILLPVLSKMEKETNVKYYADGNNTTTSGIVVDPSLPCYFVINKEKFKELPDLLLQLRIETMLRQLQYEQINPIWPSEISEKTIETLIPQILNYEEYTVFLLENDKTKEENLLTITINHCEINNNNIYDNKKKPYIYIPIFTDNGLIRESISYIEYYYSEQITNQTISIVTMKGENILQWLNDNKDVHGLMFNPKEDIFEGNKNLQLPEDKNPKKHPDKAVPKISYPNSILSSEYYSLPDFPLLPYLCVIKRSSLF